MGNITRNVTVVIPAYNEEDNIADAIMSILLMEHSHTIGEIIVVNNKSTDRTASIAAKYAKVRVVLAEEEQSGIYSSSFGISLVHKDNLILHMDSDCRASEDLLVNFLTVHKDSIVQIGHMTLTDKSTSLVSVIDDNNGNYFPRGACFFGAASLLQSESFDYHLVLVGDTEYLRKFHLVYNVKAKFEHIVSIGGYMKKKLRYGRGNTLKRHNLSDGAFSDFMLLVSQVLMLPFDLLESFCRVPISKIRKGYFDFVLMPVYQRLLRIYFYYGKLTPKKKVW